MIHGDLRLWRRHPGSLFLLGSIREPEPTLALHCGLCDVPCYGSVHNDVQSARVPVVAVISRPGGLGRRHYFDIPDGLESVACCRCERRTEFVPAASMRDVQDEVDSLLAAGRLTHCGDVAIFREQENPMGQESPARAS